MPYVRFLRGKMVLTPKGIGFIIARIRGYLANPFELFEGSFKVLPPYLYGGFAVHLFSFDAIFDVLDLFSGRFEVAVVIFAGGFSAEDLVGLVELGKEAIELFAQGLKGASRDAVGMEGSAQLSI